MADLVTYNAPPHLDAKALIRRANALLNRWTELYGEHNPQWLPPDGIVNWQEDAAQFLTAHTLPAPTAWAHACPTGMVLLPMWCNCSTCGATPSGVAPDALPSIPVSLRSGASSQVDAASGVRVDRHQTFSPAAPDGARD